MDALEIIDNLKKVYAACETYSDVGVTVMTDAQTGDAEAPKQHFQTFYRRPGHYRCSSVYDLPATDSEMAEGRNIALAATDGVLWSDGATNKHYITHADATEDVADTAHLFGPSLDPIFRGKAPVPDLIARLLMPAVFKDYDQFPFAREYWSVPGETPVDVDGIACWPVMQDLMVYKETLWVSATDYSLRRHTRDIDYSFADHPRVKSLIETSSKMMRYLFKQFPDLSKDVLDRGARHYRTTFSTITLNQPVSAEQLEFRH